MSLFPKKVEYPFKEDPLCFFFVLLHFQLSLVCYCLNMNKVYKPVKHKVQFKGTSNLPGHSIPHLKITAQAIHTQKQTGARPSWVVLVSSVLKLAVMVRDDVTFMKHSKQLANHNSLVQQTNQSTLCIPGTSLYLKAN